MTIQTQTLPRLDPHLVYAVDAVASLAMGVALLFLAAPLTQLAGWSLPDTFLRTIGLLLLPWAVLNASVARAAHPPRLLVRAIGAGDMAWVAGTAALVLVHLADLSPIGLALLLGQGLAVSGVLLLKLAGARALA